MLETTVPKCREWIPPMLRKSRALSLCLFSALFVAMLEVMSILVTNNQGISTHDTHLVYVVRYFPTAGTVVLGYIWKALVGDVKMILPWSLMSAGWANSADSITLNYINSIDIASVIMATKRKHWMLVLVLTVGFLTGLSVAIANILTYTEPTAIVKINKELVKTSSFTFDNAFVFPNDTISIPTGHLGGKAYADVTAERLPGGKFAPWTADGRCFESFNDPSGGLSHGSIIEATVSSISVEFKCEKLDVWTPVYNGPPRRGSEVTIFGANTTNYSSFHCQETFWQNRPSSDEHDPYNSKTSFGWTNVTTRSNSTKRILATITRVGPDKDTMYISTGLLCNTLYTSQDSSVQVDASSGDVGYTILSDPVPTNISLSTEAEWIYLNNPTDFRFQAIRITRVSTETVFHAAEELALQYNDDPFFTMLTNGQLDEAVHTYMNNTDRFQSDVEYLAKNILVQLVNTLGRRNKSQEIPGSITISESRLLIQRTALRGLQIILLVVCIACLLASFILRPSSCLLENPASIAATAVILAASSTGTERFFARLNCLSDECICKSLSESQSKLSFNQRPCVEMEALSLPSADTSTLVEDDSANSKSQNGKGWRPLALRAWGKWGTISVLCGVIATLAILQSFSTKHTGLISSSPTAQATLGYTTTFILLNLSWICSGIDASVKSLNSYNSLRDLSRRRPLLLKSRGSLTFWIPFQATGMKSGLAIISSSLILLLFPFIKIVAAGLFADTQLAPARTNVSAVMDTSLMDNLERIGPKILDNSRPMIEQRASQFTEWTIMPSINMRPRAGIVDNLVIANFSWLDHRQGSEIYLGDELWVRVPAIAVDVHCSGFSEDEFDIGIHYDNHCGAYLPDFWCKSTNCRNSLAVTNEELSDLIHLRENTGSEENGTVCSPQPYTGVCHGRGATWQAILADFTTFSPQMFSSVTNRTMKNTTNAADWPGLKLPTLRMISCRSSLSLVEVNTSFLLLRGSVATGFWTPNSVDRDSIAHLRPYDELQLDELHMPWNNWVGLSALKMQYTLHSIGGVLNDSTLWPSAGDSTNPFQLLAAFAEYKHHNLTALLNSSQLARIGEEMQTALITQMLTELRPFAANLANSSFPSKRTIQGIMIESHARIGQDLRTTIILEVLLALVLICVVWIFSRFTGDAILPRKPDSIAARLSLLAGSRLVEILRKDGIESIKDTDIWEEPSSLGWWKVSDFSNVGNGSRRWRWGIDVGTDVYLSRWNKPPKDTDSFKGVSTEDNISSDSPGDGPQGMDTGNADGVIEPLLPFGEDVSDDGQNSEVQWSDDGIALRSMTL